jgi:CHAT domain-containing protein
VAFTRLQVPARGSDDGQEGPTRYWIERQVLRVVGVGRDLLSQEQPDATAGMLALGGIDYERFPEQAQPRAGAVTAAPEPTASSSSASSPAPVLLAMNERLRAERDGFQSLEETEAEAQEVSNYYWDEQGGQSVILNGTEASEARLKALERPPRLLHLATHGFFLSQEQDANAAGPATGFDRALTLSGLALAGANLGLQGKTGPNGEDGILYALEAQDLNLEGTELVTLSACDTGRGRVDVSEGVYGLVRALQIAGTRHVLMTQWALNDRAARAFMVDFYRRWLDPDAFEHPADALRATQLEWIRSDDPVKADPRLWAPYVLIERG